MKTIKTLLALGIVVFSGIAQAHDYNSELGQDKTATDFHSIFCSEDSNRMYFSFSAYDASSTDLLVTANVVGDNNTFSITTGGNSTANKGVEIPTTGEVLILVSKNKAGSVNYSFSYHCLDANNNHTETLFNTFQNQ